MSDNLWNQHFFNNGIEGFHMGSIFYLRKAAVENNRLN